MYDITQQLLTIEIGTVVIIEWEFLQWQVDMSIQVAPSHHSYSTCVHDMCMRRCLPHHHSIMELIMLILAFTTQVVHTIVILVTCFEEAFHIGLDERESVCDIM